MTQDEAMSEMKRRYAVMKGACERALAGQLEVSMQLLDMTAHKIWNKGKSRVLPFWDAGTRAAVRAMAVMHANGGMDVVCAAPTGGAAGALPGVVITLEEELGLTEDETCMALWAAGAVGLILDARATFAAEVAGCQVEIGAGGAMASADCVEASGGSVRETLDAAAVAFQNTMGSVCDPVQGIVEIPCHTRNAAAAGSAFVNAALVMGGYKNYIPLDETIDAVYETGKMLPPELRCTSLGGLSLCPSAIAMKRLR
jgi:L-serine dehydratase